MIQRSPLKLSNSRQHGKDDMLGEVFLAAIMRWSRAGITGMQPNSRQETVIVETQSYSTAIARLMSYGSPIRPDMMFGKDSHERSKESAQDARSAFDSLHIAPGLIVGDGREC
jgi:hypothetical protein